MSVNSVTEENITEKSVKKPNENTADTDAEVKSVLMQSINDVVASVEECEDNKSEYESIGDDGESNSVDIHSLPVNTSPEKEKKHESAQVEIEDSINESVEELADKEIDSNEVFIDEEGGEEAFAEMNEDDEYEDIEDSEDDEELKVETLEPPFEKKHNVSEPKPCPTSSDSPLNFGGTHSLCPETKTKTAEEPEAIENEAYVEGERQQGDGQESGDQSGNVTDDLDDDEDKRNPQYIPKRGAFYEHDDRMVASVEETVEKVPEEPVIIAKNVESAEKVVKKGKKLWSESDKWSHDLFNEDEQKPKSKEEMLSTYGYDIRNEDHAPKARRRRRYGRGPGRYTRNWQDEDAYSKLKPERKNSQSSTEKEIDNDRKSKPLRGGKRRPAFKKDDFPELPSNDREQRREKNFGRDSNSTVWNKPRSIEKERRQLSPVEFKTEPMKVIEAIENNRRSSITVDPLKVEMVKTQTFENSRYTSKRCDEPMNGREKSNYPSNTHVNSSELGRPIRKTSHLQDNNKSMNYNSPKGDHVERKSRNKPKNTKDDVFLDESRNTYNQNYVSDVNAGMQKLNIDKVNRSGENDSTQQRPKRYSSLRQQQQRSVPEGLTSPMPASTQNIAVSHQQRPAPQNQFYDAGPHSPGFYPETASPRSSFAYIQQNSGEVPPQPNQHPSRFMPHQMSPRYLPQSTPETSTEPAFIPQAIPPPTPPQTSSSHPPVLTAPAASFMPTYPPGYPQFPPPQAQFHPLPTPSQAEIYRGGVTYYDPTAQQASMRQLPQRRPKNAIPIVPPPVEM